MPKYFRIMQRVTTNEVENQPQLPETALNPPIATAQSRQRISGIASQNKPRTALPMRSVFDSNSSSSSGDSSDSDDDYSNLLNRRKPGQGKNMSQTERTSVQHDTRRSEPSLPVHEVVSDERPTETLFGPSTEVRRGAWEGDSSSEEQPADPKDPGVVTIYHTTKIYCAYGFLCPYRNSPEWQTNDKMPRKCVSCRKPAHESCFANFNRKKRKTLKGELQTGPICKPYGKQFL